MLISRKSFHLRSDQFDAHVAINKKSNCLFANFNSSPQSIVINQLVMTKNDDAIKKIRKKQKSRDFI